MVVFILFGWLTIITIAQAYLFLKKTSRRPGPVDEKKYVQTLREVESKVRELSLERPRYIQYTGIIRFSAFADVGSDQSFALAMLDAKGNGAVLSSVHGRATTRMYAKPIVNFKSLRHELSKEEERAIKLAIETKKH